VLEPAKLVLSFVSAVFKSAISLQVAPFQSSVAAVVDGASPPKANAPD
jgi:hypothetical protein